MEPGLKVIAKANPDRVEVPPMQVAVLTERAGLEPKVAELVRSLSGQRKRDWFSPYFYNCLPLTIANQYGFVVVLETATRLTWDGTANKTGLAIAQPDRGADAVQGVLSHFGHGIVTVHLPWVFRTARGVNLMVGPPPNYFVDGLMWMSGVVETDQLRNDFTFNLKLTRPGTVELPAGIPIGHFMPVPRNYCDQHALVVHDEGAVLEAERTAQRDFEALRHGVLKGEVGHLYRLGYDVYGNPLPDHQSK